MTRKNDPAFPQTETSQNDSQVTLDDGAVWQRNSGMTLRQWYAGQAANGLISPCPNVPPEDLAIYAFQVADALIAEGEKDEV